MVEAVVRATVMVLLEQVQDLGEIIQLTQATAGAVLRPLMRPKLSVTIASNAAGPVRCHIGHNRIQGIQIKAWSTAIFGPLGPQAMDCFATSTDLCSQQIVLVVILEFHFVDGVCNLLERGAGTDTSCA